MLGRASISSLLQSKPAPPAVEFFLGSSGSPAASAGAAAGSGDPLSRLVMMS